MKKLLKRSLLLLILSVSALNASNWNDINKYESFKISDDRYQVKTLNKGDFTENNLILNKINDKMIKDGNCLYYAGYNPNTFEFIGNGSIKCNNKNIEFISQLFPDRSSVISDHLFIDFIVYGMLPGVLFLSTLILILGTFFKIRSFFFVGMIFFVVGIPFVIYFRGIVYESLSSKANSELFQIMENHQRDRNITYYIEPKLIY